MTNHACILNMCRGCLKTTSLSDSIHYMDKEKNIPILQKAKYVYPDIKFNEVGPFMLCNTCKKAFLLSYQLKKMIYYSNFRYDSYVKLLSNISNDKEIKFCNIDIKVLNVAATEEPSVEKDEENTNLKIRINDVCTLTEEEYWSMEDIEINDFLQEDFLNSNFIEESGLYDLISTEETENVMKKEPANNIGIDCNSIPQLEINKLNASQANQASVEQCKEDNYVRRSQRERRNNVSLAIDAQHLNDLSDPDFSADDDVEYVPSIIIKGDNSCSAEGNFAEYNDYDSSDFDYSDWDNCDFETIQSDVNKCKRRKKDNLENSRSSDSVNVNSLKSDSKSVERNCETSNDSMCSRIQSKPGPKQSKVKITEEINNSVDCRTKTLQQIEIPPEASAEAENNSTVEHIVAGIENIVSNASNFNLTTDHAVSLQSNNVFNVRKRKKSDSSDSENSIKCDKDVSIVLVDVLKYYEEAKNISEKLEPSINIYKQNLGVTFNDSTKSPISIEKVESTTFSNPQLPSASNTPNVHKRPRLKNTPRRFEHLASGRGQLNSVASNYHPLTQNSISNKGLVMQPVSSVNSNEYTPEKEKLSSYDAIIADMINSGHPMAAGLLNEMSGSIYPTEDNMSSVNDPGNCNYRFIQPAKRVYGKNPSLSVHSQGVPSANFAAPQTVVRNTTADQVLGNLIEQYLFSDPTPTSSTSNSANVSNQITSNSRKGTKGLKIRNDLHPVTTNLTDNQQYPIINNVSFDQHKCNSNVTYSNSFHSPLPSSNSKQTNMAERRSPQFRPMHTYVANISSLPVENPNFVSHTPSLTTLHKANNLSGAQQARLLKNTPVNYSFSNLMNSHQIDEGITSRVEGNSKTSKSNTNNINARGSKIDNGSSSKQPKYMNRLNEILINNNAPQRWKPNSNILSPPPIHVISQNSTPASNLSSISNSQQWISPQHFLSNILPAIVTDNASNPTISKNVFNSNSFLLFRAPNSALFSTEKNTTPINPTVLTPQQFSLKYVPVSQFMISTQNCSSNSPNTLNPNMTFPPALVPISRLIAVRKDNETPISNSDNLTCSNIKNANTLVQNIQEPPENIKIEIDETYLKDKIPPLNLPNTSKHPLAVNKNCSKSISSSIESTTNIKMEKRCDSEVVPQNLHSGLKNDANSLTPVIDNLSMSESPSLDKRSVDNDGIKENTVLFTESKIAESVSKNNEINKFISVIPSESQNSTKLRSISTTETLSTYTLIRPLINNGSVVQINNKQNSSLTEKEFSLKGLQRAQTNATMSKNTSPSSIGKSIDCSRAIGFVIQIDPLSKCSEKLPSDANLKESFDCNRPGIGSVVQINNKQNLGSTEKECTLESNLQFLEKPLSKYPEKLPSDAKLKEIFDCNRSAIDSVVQINNKQNSGSIEKEFTTESNLQFLEKPLSKCSEKLPSGAIFKESFDCNRSAIGSVVQINNKQNSGPTEKERTLESNLQFLEKPLSKCPQKLPSDAKLKESFDCNRSTIGSVQINNKQNSGSIEKEFTTESNLQFLENPLSKCSEKLPSDANLGKKISKSVTKTIATMSENTSSSNIEENSDCNPSAIGSVVQINNKQNSGSTEKEFTIESKLEFLENPLSKCTEKLISDANLGKKISKSVTKTNATMSDNTSSSSIEENSDCNPSAIGSVVQINHKQNSGSTEKECTLESNLQFLEKPSSKCPEKLPSDANLGKKISKSVTKTNATMTENTSSSSIEENSDCNPSAIGSVVQINNKQNSGSTEKEFTIESKLEFLEKPLSKCPEKLPSDVNLGKKISKNVTKTNATMSENTSSSSIEENFDCSNPSAIGSVVQINHKQNSGSTKKEFTIESKLEFLEKPLSKCPEKLPSDANLGKKISKSPTKTNLTTSKYTSSSSIEENENLDKRITRRYAKTNATMSENTSSSGIEENSDCNPSAIGSVVQMNNKQNSGSTEKEFTIESKLEFLENPLSKCPEKLPSDANLGKKISKSVTKTNATMSENISSSSIEENSNCNPSAIGSVVQINHKQNSGSTEKEFTIESKLEFLENPLSKCPEKLPSDANLGKKISKSATKTNLTTSKYTSSSSIEENENLGKRITRGYAKINATMLKNTSSSGIEDSFDCNHCKKKFSSSVLLAIHQRNTHKETLDFRCSIISCDKTFSNSSLLISHKVLCHGKRKCKEKQLDFSKPKRST